MLLELFNWLRLVKVKCRQCFCQLPVRCRLARLLPALIGTQFAVWLCAPRMQQISRAAVSAGCRASGQWRPLSRCWPLCQRRLLSVPALVLVQPMCATVVGPLYLILVTVRPSVRGLWPG